MTPTNSEQSALRTTNNKAILLKRVRQLHLYLGVFFAPAIIFFSLTGALQLFGLHEGHPGEPYQPPQWVEALASIHKDQVVSRPHGPPPGSDERQEATPPDSGMKRPPEKPHEAPGPEEEHAGKATLALKWFFLAMSIGLVATTMLGIYMAFKYNRSPVLVWVMLIGGAAIPLALIAATAF